MVLVGIHTPWIELAVIGFLAMLYGSLTAAVCRQKSIEIWDYRLGNWFIARATPGRDRVFSALTTFGSYLTIRNTAILICIWLVYERDWSRALMLIVLVIGGNILSTVLQHSVSRVRPNYERDFLYGVEYSFPSGHTLLATAFYAMVAYLGWVYGQGTALSWIIILLSILLVLLIGLSRLYLSVHYFSDVLGGWITGLLLFFILLLARSSVYFFLHLR